MERETEQLSKNSLNNLAKRAGIKSISAIVYSHLRGLIRVELENILQKAVIYASHLNKKTINDEMIQASLPIHIYSFSKEACPQYRSKPNKKVKSKPGTVALRKIRFYQKNSNCLLLAKASFKKLVKNVLNVSNYPKEYRISEKALILLQHFIETYVTKLLENAYSIALQANRTTLNDSDISIARRITKNFN